MISYTNTTVETTMQEQTLISLGLCKNAVKVYLAILEIGAGGATTISKKSGIHRANTYETVNKLVKMGLVAYIDSEEGRTFRCTDPQNLKKMLSQKQEMLDSILPELKGFYEGSKKEEMQVSLLHGNRAFVQLLESFQGAEMLLCNLPDSMPIGVKAFFKHFSKTAKIRCIHSDANTCLEKNRINPDLKGEVTTIVCKNEVLLTTWSTQASTIHIRNPNVANSYRNLFEFMYKFSVQV